MTTDGKLEEKEIEVGSGLILEFAGFVKCLDVYAWRSIEGDYILPFRSVTYHLSYDTLMSIVEKIIKLKIDGYTPFIEITNHGSSIEVGKKPMKFSGVRGESMLINTWVAVVEFLDWYLKTK